MDEVTILDSEDYTEISQEELIQAFDTGFDRALEEDRYVWESDISPSEIETLLSESENFAAAKNTEKEGENRYAFLIEGNLQHFDNQYNLAPRNIRSINTSPVILKGNIWEKPEKGLFTCHTNFEIP